MYTTGKCNRITLTWVGLAYVGIIGNGLAFVIFFNGLARTTATPAAFLHDTLVIWVITAGTALVAWRMPRHVMAT